MDTPFYPTLSDGQILPLKVVLEQLKTVEDYLDRPECPYTPVIKDFLRRFQPQPAVSVAPPVLFEEGQDKLEVIEAQVASLIVDLDHFGRSLGSAEHSERLQYFKTKTGLLEKLIDMRERTLNLREMHVFRQTVMGFLEEICTKDQTTELMRRLEA